ncbi:MAG: fimbrillin family protein [Marinifilaceae bacterium]
MKKIFLFATTVATLASCSMNEVTPVPQIEDDPEVISFNSFTGKQSKVADNTLKTLEASTAGFNVYATVGSTPTSFHLSGDTYICTNGTWDWKNKADKHKWSAITVYPAKFYAAFPSQTMTVPATPKFNYTVESGLEKGDTQIDLLAAHATRNVLGTGAVPFPFEHVLSKIDFKVNVDAAVKVYIQTIRIWNAGNIATYTFGQGWSVPVATTHKYGYLPLSKENNAIEYTGSKSVGTSANAMMMMPQTTVAWIPQKGAPMARIATNEGTYIEVVYRMVEAATPNKDVVGYTDATQHSQYATLGGGLTGGLWVKVGYGFATKWDPATQYTYTINLGTQGASGGNLIDGNFIDDNGNSTQLPVETPDSKEPIEPGDPIVDTDKYIDFDVSVNPWKTSDVTINK